MDSSRKTLLQSLANTISDYRQNEIAPITSQHIETWLNQFDFSDQPIILAEMDSILKRFYFPRIAVKKSILEFLKMIISNLNPRELLPNLYFLNIQKAGSSQGALLGIVDEILHEEYGCSLSLSGTPEVPCHIYIDDAIYTGNRLRYDLTDGNDTAGWLSTCPSSAHTLFVYTIASHIEGINYVRSYIQNASKRKQIKVFRKTTLQVNNIHSRDNSIEVLWPENMHDSYVSSYAAELEASLAQKGRFDNLFRNITSSEEMLFSSIEARRIVEQAFLKKGVQLVRTCKQPTESIRPLGYTKLDSLGFGTFFVTYRNIANNCPLVLWWGDPTYPPSHPLGQWYPLFPRRTNKQRDIIIPEQIFDNPF